MNSVRVGTLAVAVLACFAGTATAKTIDVDFGTSNYMRIFEEPELQKIGSGYYTEFTDTFTFTLTEGGELSFTFSEKDETGFHGDKVDITSAEFLEGVVPTSITPWMKEIPFDSGSNLISTYTWDYLAPGEYNLEVTGIAYATSYPLTFYQMNNVSFTAGDPIPEPATLALVGLGLVGIAGYARKNRKK